jgi:hypothetical protein
LRRIYFFLDVLEAVFAGALRATTFFAPVFLAATFFAAGFTADFAAGFAAAFLAGAFFATFGAAFFAAGLALGAAFFAGAFVLAEDVFLAATGVFDIAFDALVAGILVLLFIDLLFIVDGAPTGIVLVIAAVISVVFMLPLDLGAEAGIFDFSGIFEAGTFEVGIFDFGEVIFFDLAETVALLVPFALPSVAEAGAPGTEEVATALDVVVAFIDVLGFAAIPGFDVLAIISPHKFVRCGKKSAI